MKLAARDEMDGELKAVSPLRSATALHIHTGFLHRSLAAETSGQSQPSASSRRRLQAERVFETSSSHFSWRFKYELFIYLPFRMKLEDEEENEDDSNRTHVIT